MMNLVYSFCPVQVPAHFALKKGFLEKKIAVGDVEITHLSNLPISMWTCHFDHRIKNYIRFGGNIPAIWARSQGSNTRVIAASFSHQSQAILVQDDSSISGIEDLKNCRLLLPSRLENMIDFPRAKAERGYKALLDFYGLSERECLFKDVPIHVPNIKRTIGGPTRRSWSLSSDVWLNFPQEQEVKAIIANEGEAMYTSMGREYDICEKTNLRILCDISKEIPRPNAVNTGDPYICTARQEFLDEHPDLITDILNSFFEAVNWASENRREVLEISAESIGIKPESIIKSYPEDYHSNLSLEMNDRVKEALKLQKDFLYSNGYIKNDFDVDGWMDETYLNQAVSMSN